MVKKSYNVESQKYENVPFSYPNHFRKLHHFEPLATCLALDIRLNEQKNNRQRKSAGYTKSNYYDLKNSQ